MLAMVPYLQEHKGIPLADLAKEFKITTAQAQRELDLLMMTGWGTYHGEMIDFDITALETDGVVHIRDAEFMPRPLRITRSEAAALVVALQALRQGATDQQPEYIDSALLRLAEASGLDLAQSVAVQGPPDIDPAVQAAVAEALASGRVLSLIYATEGRDEQTERNVEPFRVFDHDGKRYLAAWCHQAEADRHFRLDRIVSATVTSQQVSVEHSGASLDTEVFRYGASTPSALVEISASAKWLVEEYPIEVQAENADGSITARIYGSDYAWLSRVVLRSAGRMRVLEPQELAEMVSSSASAALAAYDGTIHD